MRKTWYAWAFLVCLLFMFRCASQEAQYKKLTTKDQFQRFAEKHRDSELGKKAQKIADILAAPYENLPIRNLGAAVNSDSDDYYPVVSPDGKTLYFCSTRPGGFGGEDIWVSKMENGRWTEARNIGPPLNTEKNEGVMSVSADGLTLYLFGGYAGTIGGGDIFVSHLEVDRWTDPQILSKQVNSRFWDVDASITSDGRALLFASSRPRVTGEVTLDDIKKDSDIYVSILAESGWSRPINLGPTINTEYDERSPFLHPDGKTLYFCSRGQAGLGDFDVYTSVRTGKSWTQWSEPINLGQEINTPGKDVFYTIPASGEFAYFSSRRYDTYGGLDIYSIGLPEVAKPTPVTMISGKITDKEGNPLAAEITWEDLDTGEKLGVARSNSVTGEYTIFLPAGRRYSYTASKDGYFFESGYIDLRGRMEYEELSFDFSLKPVKAKEEITVRNLFFNYNQADLRAESMWELNRLIKIMTEYPRMQIEIQGHTCSLGSDEYNLGLSERRARAVLNYLVDHGVARSRLLARGYGEKYPIASNDTEEGREKNRRVVIKILSVE